MDRNGSQVTLRQATPKDSDLVYNIKKEALGWYVEQTWGWDEKWQQEFHRTHYRPTDISIIVEEGMEIGTVGINQHVDAIWLESLHILQEYQNRGIGSYFVEQAIARATTARLPVRLKVLKVNPARKLYQRFGFVDIEETDDHFVMEQQTNDAD